MAIIEDWKAVEKKHAATKTGSKKCICGKKFGSIGMRQMHINSANYQDFEKWEKGETA